MPSFPRCLPIAALALLLAACQSAQQPEVQSDALASDLQQLDQELTTGRLVQAGERLTALKRATSGDARLARYQRQLADAWLARGQSALQRSDLETAAKALGHARGLMPKAPALTNGLDQAIETARGAADQVADGV